MAASVFPNRLIRFCICGNLRNPWKGPKEKSGIAEAFLPDSWLPGFQIAVSCFPAFLIKRFLIRVIRGSILSRLVDIPLSQTNQTDASAKHAKGR